MDHQRQIADIALEIDPDTGEFAYSQIIVIGPRQVTGKTELILPILTHRCLGVGGALGPQRVVYMAQTVEAARQKWRDVHVPRLQTSAFRDYFSARLRTAAEAIMWSNGSIWFPSGAGQGATGSIGDTLDLGVIDEAWARKDHRMELGLLPTMMTRRNSQLWICSMIPGLSLRQPGEWPYLKQKLDMGRELVESDVRSGVAFFEFSAPRDSDPGDPATWRSCMPGLRDPDHPEAFHTAREEKILAAFRSLPLVDFCAEYLGWPPDGSITTKWKLIPREMWMSCFDPVSEINGRPAMAIEISEDRTRAYIGVAGTRDDGNWHIEVIEPGGQIAPITANVAWVEPRVLELVEQWKPVTVVIDPRRPANSLIPALRRRRIDVTTPNQNQIAGGCAQFLDATGASDTPSAERVFHLGQPELDDALAHAKKLDLGEGTFTIVRRGSSADLGAAYSVILAMLGYAQKGFKKFPAPDIFA